IMVADQYAPRGGAGSHAGAGAPPTAQPAPGRTGIIARYARGEDYHAVIRRRLHTLADTLRTHHPGGEFRTFVDTAPVMGGAHAAYTHGREGCDVLEVLGWTEEDRRRAFATSAMKRADLETIKRNAGIVAENLPEGVC